MFRGSRAAAVAEHAGKVFFKEPVRLRAQLAPETLVALQQLCPLFCNGAAAAARAALRPADDGEAKLVFKRPYGVPSGGIAHLYSPAGLAEEHGLDNAHKRDSQDICFVPDGDYAAFIRRWTGKDFPPGDFVGTGGEIYGRHKGIIHYTVGQRKGLGLSFPQPMFVKELDVGKNQVVLAKAEELFSQTAVAQDINLISVESIPRPLRVKAKVRYRQQEQPATVLQTGPDQLTVTFDTPQRAVTPGQSLVLYDGDTVVGGGKIVGKNTGKGTGLGPL